MAKKITFSAIIIFLVLVCAEAPKPTCNSEDSLFKKCALSLPGLGSNSDSAIASNKEELEKSCIDLRTGIKCVDDYTERCMEKYEKVVFQRVSSGMRKAIDNLCNLGSFQDEYMTHSTCLSAVSSDYDMCNSKYSETLLTLTTKINNPNRNENQLQSVCCSFEEYLLCSEMAVQKKCGDEAAKFTRKYLQEMSSNIITIFCLDYTKEQCGLSGATYHQQSTLLIGVVIFTHLLAYLKGKLVPT